MLGFFELESVCGSGEGRAVPCCQTSQGRRAQVESGFWCRIFLVNRQSRGNKLGEINLFFLVSGSRIKNTRVPIGTYSSSSSTPPLLPQKESMEEETLFRLTAPSSSL